MDPLQQLNDSIIACQQCPRLREHCRSIANTRKPEFASHSYWGLPVAGFGDPEARLRALVRRHIEEAATQEWPMMASRAETLSLSSRALTDAVRLTLGLAPSNSGQQIAQREIITALRNALDARQQPIVISRSEGNFIKWSCLFLLAVCALIAIVMVHSDNRLTAMIASGMFATGVAASALLILAHDRPFTGQISISATPLMQVMPELAESTK